MGQIFLGVFVKPLEQAQKVPVGVVTVSITILVTESMSNNSDWEEESPKEPLYLFPLG